MRLRFPRGRSCDVRELAATDSISAEAVTAASERELRRAWAAIHWIALAALALALGPLYVLSASAEKLIGIARRVADGETVTVRTARFQDYRIRMTGLDARSRGRQSGITPSRTSLTSP